MKKYRLVGKKGEGTFSEVLKAQNVKDGRYHAIKCMKNRFESLEQVNNLREIQALRRLSPHDYIIKLEEVLYDQPTGRLALVFELMDANLYELIKGRRHYLNPQLIKSYMFQLMKSIDHMHKKGIFHRDIKPENVLIESSTEAGKGLKLADFGSCRGIYSKHPYTEYISTRWYRAPECLLTDGYYGPEMDLWGVGCVMFEIISLYPLFPGTNEVDQINRIHKVLGTPSGEVLQKLKAKGASHISFDFQQYKGVDLHQLIPHASNDCVDLLIKLLKYDAADRITAREATKHNYFKDVREAEQRSLSKTDGSDSTSVSSSVIQGSNNANGLVSKSEKNQMPPMKSQQQYQQYQQLQNSIKPMNTTFPQPGVNQQVKLMEASKNQYGVNNAAGGSTMLPAIGILSGQQLQQQQQQQKYMMQQQQQIQQQAQLQQQAQQRIMQITNQQKRKKKYRLNNYGNKIGQQPNMMSQIKPMQIGGDPYLLKK